MSYKGHVFRVRKLYKAILRLHRGLPPQVQTLGTQYVKEEFKKHKNCDPSFVPIFMKEWTDYAVTLAKQLSKQPGREMVGRDMTEKEIKAFDESQLEQIYELFNITQELKASTGHDKESFKS